MACRPWWSAQFLPLQGELRKKTRLTNCPANDVGVVPCSPEQLRKQAEAKLRTFGIMRRVTHNDYALARYVASEHGSGSPEEKMALALLAIRRARMWKTSPYQLLACRNKWGDCVYGPINVVSGERGISAPFGRWAATSLDPSLDDLLIAQFAMSGDANSFLPHGDDQDGPKHFDTDAYVAKVKRYAQARNYWIGPVPGISANEVFIYARREDVHPESRTGQAYIQRAVDFIRGPRTEEQPTAFCPRMTPGARVAVAGVAGVLVIGLAWAVTRYYEGVITV